MNCIRTRGYYVGFLLKETGGLSACCAFRQNRVALDNSSGRVQATNYWGGILVGSGQTSISNQLYVGALSRSSGN